MGPEPEDIGMAAGELEEEAIVYICVGPPKCRGMPWICPWCKACVTDEDFANLEPTEH